MVFFADAYFPYLLRSRVLARERREQERRHARMAPAPVRPPPPDLELQQVNGDVPYLS